MATSSNFREDINALRALAVVAVVGFHVKLPGFAGGFVGVDIFLVLTGYLMTLKVINGLAVGDFSVWAFWFSRSRRIFPALAVMVAISIIAGWFLTLPSDYSKQLLQAVSALTFLSNFAFSSDSGYFSLPSQTKPLLHTWSLAVEWQFYFWLPLTAAAIAMLGRKKEPVFFAVVVATAIASLIWCIWQSYSDVSSSPFFSLRTRAWEPLMGAVIALAERRGLSVKSHLVALVGWVVAIGSVGSHLSEQGWPNIGTLAPTVGTALVILGNSQKTLFSAAPIRKLGEWSYSIYLWHWPIWVFTNSWLAIRLQEIDLAGKLVITAASVVAGAASYYLVERPILANQKRWDRKTQTALFSAVFVPCCVITITAYSTQGIPWRFPIYIRAAEDARSTSTPRDDCFRNENSEKKASEVYCGFGGGLNTNGQQVLLWGDSFANQYLVPITQAVIDLGMQGLIATQGACHPSLSGRQSAKCNTFNSETVSFIASPGSPQIVVIGGNWGTAVDPIEVIKFVHSVGKTPVLILPNLKFDFDIPSRWIAMQTIKGEAISEWKIEPSRSEQNADLRAQIIAANDGRILFDPQQVVCDEGSCYLVKNGSTNFRDQAHISNLNSGQYLGVIKAALQQALIKRD